MTNLIELLLSVFFTFSPIPAQAATALTATQTSIVYGASDCYAFDPTVRYVVNTDEFSADVAGYNDEAFTYAISGTGSASIGTFSNGNSNVEVHSGATSGGYATYYETSNDSAADGLALSATTQCLKWRSAPIDTDLLQRMEIIGFGSNPINSAGYATGGADSCVCFRIDVTTPNAAISAVTKSGATETVTSSGYTEVLDTQQNYEIVATSTSVTFFVNSVAVATHTANIPTAVIFPVFSVRSKAAGSRGVQVDWLQYSRPRS